MRRVVSGIMLGFLLVSTLVLAFNVGLVRAQAPQTVYINSDGSVSPSSAPISSVDNVTYTFTGNMSYPSYDGIVVERNNTVIDGNSYTMLGNNSGNSNDQSVGLNLTDTSNVTIENTNIENFQNGIYLSGSNNNIIRANTATANGLDGIWLNSSSNNNTVSDNNAKANLSCGIDVIGSSNNNTVSGNTATANGYFGIILTISSNNTVSGNTATANNDTGIQIYSSSGNILSDNVIEDNKYNFNVLGYVLSDFMNSVDTSNLVNGKPIYYMTSKSNLVISSLNYPNVGYLALVNCTNMTVEGLTLANVCMQGILLAFTNDSKITDNNVANNYDGIYLRYSSNDTVDENTATANGVGIDIYSSSNNTVSGNNATADSVGIVLQSYSDIVSGNNVTANGDGIYLIGSSNSTIIGNNVTANNAGIYLDGSSNNTISGNNATANTHGIVLIDSSNNTFSGNTVAANSQDGIWLMGSSNNTLCCNNFINNTLQVDSDKSPNVWDNGYPSGGNYWSDYQTKYPNAVENDSSGIWNTPYVIDTNNTDHYPLMVSYVVPEFPLILLLPLFMIATLLAVAFYKKKAMPHKRL